MENSAVIQNMGKLAQEVYDENNQYFTPNSIGSSLVGVPGYQIKEISPDSGNGFQALLLKKTDLYTAASEYVFAFRGTEGEFSVEGWHDLIETDILQMGTKAIAAQFLEAIMFVHEMIATTTYNLTPENTTLTGHSLGGAIGTAVSYAFGMQSFGYNPFGIENHTLFQANTLGEIFQLFADTAFLQMPWDDPINPPQISDLAADLEIDAVKFATFYNLTEPLSKHVEDNANFVAVDRDVQEFVSGGITDIAGGLTGEVQPIMTHAGGELWNHISFCIE